MNFLRVILMTILLLVIMTMTNSPPVKATSMNSGLSSTTVMRLYSDGTDVAKAIATNSYSSMAVYATSLEVKIEKNSTSALLVETVLLNSGLISSNSLSATMSKDTHLSMPVSEVTAIKKVSISFVALTANIPTSDGNAVNSDTIVPNRRADSVTAKHLITLMRDDRSHILKCLLTSDNLSVTAVPCPTIG